MVGRKNAHISLWWAAMLPTLGTAAIECVTDLNKRSKMIIFEPLLTTLETSIILANFSWLDPKNLLP